MSLIMGESLQRKIFAHKIFDPQGASLRKCVHFFGHFLVPFFRTLAYSHDACVNTAIFKILVGKIFGSLAPCPSHTSQ